MAVLAIGASQAANIDITYFEIWSQDIHFAFCAGRQYTIVTEFTSAQTGSTSIGYVVSVVTVGTGE